MASGGADAAVYVWDVRCLRASVQRMEGHVAPINQV